MYKKKVTNISASSAKGGRPIFLTETGKLLKPGESCVLNRINPGTQRYVADGLLKVTEGSFAREPIFPEKQPTEPVRKKPVEVEVAPPAPQPTEVAAPEEPPAPQPEPAAPSVSSEEEVAEAAPPEEVAEAAPSEEADAPAGDESSEEAQKPTRRGRRRRS